MRIYLLGAILMLSACAPAAPAPAPTPTATPTAAQRLAIAQTGQSGALADSLAPKFQPLLNDLSRRCQASQDAVANTILVTEKAELDRGVYQPPLAIAAAVDATLPAGGTELGQAACSKAFAAYAARQNNGR